MKRIQCIDNATVGLAAYLEEDEEDKNWDGFRNHNLGVSYRELAHALVHIQHGLCGYCEIDIKDVDRQIEHVCPQSDPDQGALGILDHTNMIACCKGGTSASSDSTRTLLPVKRNLSCGQAKDDLVDTNFIDPRTLPDLPSLIQVDFEGQINANPEACEICGITIDNVSKTIEILGLNNDRLRNARKSRWTALSENWSNYFEDPQLMEAAARDQLLPDESNQLTNFFTTSRSFFGDYSERVLAEHPQKWI